MKRIALLLLLLALPVRGEEEKPPDPYAGLPKCLRPGAKATFVRSPGDGRLKGTVEYRAKAGGAEGTVELVLTYDSGDLGPLTVRDRLVAEVEAKSRRVLSFTYEVGGKKTPLRTVARLGPHPEKEGKLLHEKIRYDAKGDAKTTRRRITPPEEAWAPDLLEPFLWREELRILTVTGGTLRKTPVRYVRLGKGEMDLGDEEVPCLILRREAGDAKTTVYVRASDGMPLRHPAARLTIEGGR